MIVPATVPRMTVDSPTMRERRAPENYAAEDVASQPVRPQPEGVLEGTHLTLPGEGAGRVEGRQNGSEEGGQRDEDQEGQPQAPQGLGSHETDERFPPAHGTGKRRLEYVGTFLGKHNAPLLLVANPGVQPSVQQVYHEVENQEDAGEQ